MDTTIAAPASCEVRAVMRFLHAEGQSAAEIHRRLCRVYGDTVMSDNCVRKWCRKFCQEIRPPLPSSAEETSRPTPFFGFCESQSIVLVPTVHRTYGNPICPLQFDTN